MYDTAFFNLIREGCQRSAAAVVPLLLHRLAPVRSVVDVGCGEGVWGAEFQSHGCDVLGIDGDYVTDPLIPFRAHDLTEPLKITRRFDLAVCLEVAEHLPASRADGLIRDLCELADVVVFSAAIPGQGGTGHINEQWPAYWVERFGANGYECGGSLRLDIWQDDRVENWYRQNLLVAARHPGRFADVFDGSPVLPLVHPVLYDHVRKP